MASLIGSERTVQRVYKIADSIVGAGATLDFSGSEFGAQPIRDTVVRLDDHILKSSRARTEFVHANVVQLGRSVVDGVKTSCSDSEKSKDSGKGDASQVFWGMKKTDA